MADQSNSQEPAQTTTQSGPFSPQTQAASLFHIVGRASEFHLTFGRSRPVVGADGQFLPQLASEWLLSLTLSPVTMKELSRQVTETVRQYEQRYGAIVQEQLPQ